VPPTEVPPTAVPPTEVPPTEVPGPDINGYPLATLREVIAGAVADGRAGEAGEELSALADQLTDAIAADNRREAREALRELSKLINRARDLDPAFVDEVAALLDAVASAYDLRGN
jgi:ABC-type transporter Mla subunit MlaD